MHGRPLMVNACRNNTQVFFKDYLKKTLRKPVTLVKVRIKNISEPVQNEQKN